MQRHEPWSAHGDKASFRKIIHAQTCVREFIIIAHPVATRIKKPGRIERSEDNLHEQKRIPVHQRADPARATLPKSTSQRPSPLGTQDLHRWHSFRSPRQTSSLFCKTGPTLSVQKPSSKHRSHAIEPTVRRVPGRESRALLYPCMLSPADISPANDLTDQRRCTPIEWLQTEQRSLRGIKHQRLASYRRRVLRLSIQSRFRPSILWC
jgi:hypothetical protein